MPRVFNAQQHSITRSIIRAAYPMSDLRGTLRLIGGRLEFEQFNHDVFVLSYLGAPLYLQETMRTGTPVLIAVESEAGSKAIPAYVHHTAPVTGHSEGGQPMTSVVCVGASYVLKVQGTTTWNNATVSQIVTEIADRFHLLPNVDVCDYVYPTYLQANRSYWSVLRDLAMRFGYILRVDGTTLRFLKPVTATRAWFSEAAVLVQKGNQAGGFSTLGTAMSQFSSASGQLGTSDHSWQSNKVIRGFNPITGKTFMVSASQPEAVRLGDDVSPFDEYLTTAASSPTEAQAFAEGSARLNRFTHSATATALGNSFVTSDRPVYIAGTGSTDGYWTVRKAYHDIDINGSYTMTVELGTDGLGQVINADNRVLTPSLRPIRNLNAESQGVPPSVENDWYLYRSSVTPVVGQTGAQYVQAQWRHQST